MINLIFITVFFIGIFAGIIRLFQWVSKQEVGYKWYLFKNMIFWLACIIAGISCTVIIANF